MRLLHGDCLEVMRTLPDCSVDAVVTDPPYGLSFMGKKWDYDVPSVEVWAECLRVLKPGGHLLAFAGTRTQHRMAVRIEDAGFEIRDMIAWVYGSGFPKSHNLDGEWEGWGTALKPALEPITVGRKPLIGTVAENVLAHRTGALNIDGCRVDASDGRPLIESKAEKSLHAFGNGLNGSRYAGTTIQGRWPANLIHDGSDEVVGLFPQSKSTGGQSSLGAFRNGDVYGKGKDERLGEDPGYGDSGSAARFFYCAKASKRDRDDGLDDAPSKILAMSNQAKAEFARGNIHKGESGMNSAKVRKNNHPTVKPTDLMRYLCRLVTPLGGVVLDPFMGSGSTGKAAALEGFDFIGIEREAEYLAIAEARIESARTLL